MNFDPMILLAVVGGSTMVVSVLWALAAVYNFYFARAGRALWQRIRPILMLAACIVGTLLFAIAFIAFVIRVAAFIAGL